MDENVYEKERLIFHQFAQFKKFTKISRVRKFVVLQQNNFL